MKRWARLFLSAIVLASSVEALAQTTPPVPTTSANTLNLNDNVIVDIPPNWVRTVDIAIDQAFFARADARLEAAYHPVGSRPTVMPYALFEDFDAPAFPTQAEQAEGAERVRTYYLTALRPPSKAERASSWKRANVTPIAYDYPNQRFSFRAVIHFDDGTDDRVDVSGVFGTGVLHTLSVWTDDAMPVNAGVAPMLNSLRLGTPPPVQALSFQERAVRLAKICGVLLILLVVGLQAYVFMRERRQRRAEESELLRDFSA